MLDRAAHARDRETAAAAAPFEVRPLLRYELALPRLAGKDAAIAAHGLGADGDDGRAQSRHRRIRCHVAGTGAAGPGFRRYPTAATLVVDFQIDRWADLEPGQGQRAGFRAHRRPRLALACGPGLKPHLGDDTGGEIRSTSSPGKVRSRASALAEAAPPPDPAHCATGQPRA